MAKQNDMDKMLVEARKLEALAKKMRRHNTNFWSEVFERKEEVLAFLGVDTPEIGSNTEENTSKVTETSESEETYQSNYESNEDLVSKPIVKNDCQNPESRNYEENPDNFTMPDVSEIGGFDNSDDFI